VVLTLNFLAVSAYRTSSAGTDASVSGFLRYLSIGLAVCSVIPAIVATVLFVRYQRALQVFTLALHRFQIEHNRT
jgi:hypothetical protein